MYLGRPPTTRPALQRDKLLYDLGAIMRCLCLLGFAFCFYLKQPPVVSELLIRNHSSILDSLYRACVVMEIYLFKLSFSQGSMIIKVLKWLWINGTFTLHFSGRTYQTVEEFNWYYFFTALQIGLIFKQRLKCFYCCVFITKHSQIRQQDFSVTFRW